MQGNQDNLTFNENNLLVYLMDYDYIQEKYGVDKNSDEYVICALHESHKQGADVVKRDYSSVYDNIHLVYGDEKKAHIMMAIYKIVKEEIINKFLNIPGLERIYDEHFFEFEWDMHSRLDFDNHNISFYRDHFIHQVRNLYEMNEFYKNESFYNQFKKEFCYGDSKIASYVHDGIKRIKSEKSGSMEPGMCCDDADNLYIDYIIKASTAMCALFHDIGYPIIHFSKLKQRISVFMPSMYMFFGGEGNNFENIYALLCNSLLFRIVSKDELLEAVCGNENHGAVSAVAFLLTFYETGVINKISEDKRIAIEVAAVAIYNHTLKYEAIDGNVKQGYYSPIYKLNPLAYLLRLCDDIQEWERTYFEIQNIPDLLICEKCGMPVFRDKNQNKFMTIRYAYTCRCSHILHRNNDYARRKIVDIINCKEVRIKFSDAESAESVIWIDLDYDPALLLKMCLLAPTYSKYRIMDLNKFKKLLINQRFGNYKAAVARYRLTPNPFILKAAILGDITGVCQKVGSRLTNGLRNERDLEIVKLSRYFYHKPYWSAAQFLLDNNEKLTRKIKIEQSETNKEDPVEALKDDLRSLADFAVVIDDIVKASRLLFNGWASNIECQTKELIEQLKVRKECVIKIKSGTNPGAYDIYRKECEDITNQIRGRGEEINEICRKTADDLFNECRKLCEDADISDIIDNMYSDAPKELSEGRKKSIMFYLLLHIVSEFFAYINSNYYEAWKYQCIVKDRSKGKMTAASAIVAKQLKENFLELAENIVGSEASVYGIKTFIDDAIDQYIKLFEYDDEKTDRLGTTEYNNQFKTEDIVYIDAEKYAYRDSPINIKRVNSLDYYSDLDLFVKLSEYTKSVYKIIDHYDLTYISVK